MINIAEEILNICSTVVVTLNIVISLTTPLVKWMKVFNCMYVCVCVRMR